MLITKMKDDKTFFEFYIELNDIVNSRFNVGETILDSKVIKKKKIEIST